MNIGAFAVLTALSEKEGENVLMRRFNGLVEKMPFFAVAFSIFMFSLAGIPPTVGFWAKFYILKSGLDAGYTLLVILAVIGSVIAAYYYLRVVVYIFMNKADDRVYFVETSIFVKLVAGLLALLVLIFGVNPGWINTVIETGMKFIE